MTFGIRITYSIKRFLNSINSGTSLPIIIFVPFRVLDKETDHSPIYNNNS